MDEFEDASSASSDELAADDEVRGRSRSSSSASAVDARDAGAEESDDELVAREESSSSDDEVEDAAAADDDGDDMDRVACVLHAAARHMQRDHAALCDPAVGAWLAANDFCPPTTARALVDGIDRMRASSFGAAPSDATLKRGVADALSGALRDVLGRSVPAAELAGAPARVSAAERASIEKHAQVALAHHADHGSGVQALYRVLTTDPLVQKLLGTLGGTAKDAHHLAWSLSTRLGKLEAHMTMQTVVKAVQLLIPMLFRILIHTLILSSPDELDAPVVAGVTVGELGTAVFVNELHYHLTRPDATYGEGPDTSPTSVADMLRRAFNAKFAGARGSDDEEELPPLPDEEPEEGSDESDASELRAAAPPPLPPRPTPAAEAALERLLAGPADGAAALDPAAAATIATLRRAVDANATEVALAQSNLAQAQAAEAAAEVSAVDEAARAKEARRRASNRAVARFLAENAGRALESDATREAAAATHAAIGAAHQTAIAEAPRLAGGFASALRGLFARRDASAAAPKVPASEKLAAAAGKLGAVSGALTAVVDKGGDVLNHAGPVFQAMIGNVANVATILAEMVAKILASPETQKALSGVADVATKAVGGVAEQAVSAIGKGVVESVKEIADTPDGVRAVFADLYAPGKYAKGKPAMVHMSETVVHGLPRAVLYVKEHKKVQVPVSIGAMVGFALAARGGVDIAATSATFVAALYRLVRALRRRPETWPAKAVDYVRSGVALAPPRDREGAYHGEPVYAIRVPRAVDMSALNAAVDVGAWLPSHILPVLDFLCGAVAAIALKRPDLVSPAQIHNLHAGMRAVGT